MEFFLIYLCRRASYITSYITSLQGTSSMRGFTPVPRGQAVPETHGQSCRQESGALCPEPLSLTTELKMSHIPNKCNLANSVNE